MTTLKGYTKVFAVTPSDTTKLPPCQALYIGVSGDVALIAAGDTVSQIFKAVPVGQLNVSANLVKATGTTATNILGLATN
jgi:hypothetical protein